MTKVWATAGKQNRNGSFSYRFHTGNRPTERSFLVGELGKGFNPEIGEQTEETIYRGNGRWPQPSFTQILRWI